jgi:hypothetical protein
MLSPEDTGYDTTGSVMRAARAANRRELIRSKRTTRNTELLPETNEEESSGKAGRSQLTQLRGENLRLQTELAALQEQLEEYHSNLDSLDGEIETIHHGHQQEIEQYQQHLREMMEERNQMQEVNQQWEQRYQELYHSFQDSVEEEASKMVKEAAQTLILSPEHTPALLSDVVKTLEAQVRQTEDQRTVELLAVMRQAQYKSELLEQEVSRERADLANERENLRNLRESINNQASQRYKLERKRLRGRWTAGLGFISISLFSLMVLLELIFYSLKIPLAITLFVPLGVCAFLSYLFAHFYTTNRIKVQLLSALPKSTNKVPAPKQAKAGAK